MPRGIAVKPVDYKGGELSNLTSSEFSSHHRYGLFYIHGQEKHSCPFVNVKNESFKCFPE